MGLFHTVKPHIRNRTLRFFVFLSLISFVLTNGPDVPPVITCDESRNCVNFDVFTPPFPSCINGVCSCNTTDDGSPSCFHYTRDLGQSRQIYYFCAACGTIGSVCTMDEGCEPPGECKFSFNSVSYCECKRGEPYHELCVLYHSVSASSVTIWMLAFLMVLLVINAWLSARACLRTRCLMPLLARLSCCSKCLNRYNHRNESVAAHNPLSGTKSASYTISGTNFMACSDDPDLLWALELSASTMPQSSVPSTSQVNVNTSTRSFRRALQHSIHLQEIRLEEIRRQIQMNKAVVVSEDLQRNTPLSLTNSSSHSSPELVLRRTYSLPVRSQLVPYDATKWQREVKDEIILANILKEADDIRYSSNSSRTTTLSKTNSSEYISEENSDEEDSESSGSFESSCSELNIENQLPRGSSCVLDNSDQPNSSIDMENVSRPFIESVLFQDITVPLSLVLGQRTLMLLQKCQLPSNEMSL